MDSNLVYAKTPTGDEAVRQSTRVVQRNLRMVLVQVDGKTTVADLAAKIGNPRLVQSALRELEEGGFVAPTVDAVSVWEESMKAAKKAAAPEDVPPPMSQFSSFAPKSPGASKGSVGESVAAGFSSFGKPILPSASPLDPPVVYADTQEPEYLHNQQRMSAGRKALLVVVGFLVLLALAGGGYPYERFKPDLEASATRLLSTPVSIDHVGFTLFPSPSLKLRGVRIGEPVDGRIGEVLLSSPFALLGSAPHRIARVEVSDAILSANRLVALPMLMGPMAGNQEAVFQKMVVKRLQLTMGDKLGLNDLFGEIVFREDGSMEKSSFETVDRSMLVNVEAGNQGLALNIEGRAWTPPGAQVAFASLQAKGVLQKNRLVVQSIDTTFLGGIVRGSWVLNWENGLAMTGDGVLSRLDARKVSGAFAPSLRIDGEMTGNIRLRSVGSDWESLWGNVDAVLSMDITRGALHGVDLGEAVRRSGVSDVRAGSTKFDRLRSTISITPKQVVGRDIKMDAGMVTAVGQFSSARNGVVEGNMAVTMQTSVAIQNASVRVFGTLPDLSATTRR
ncbi:MAG: hypothetical protein JNJ95_07335 [Dechloromonas sp.]|nr:hypothetical protein [Dechloromonas sp.]